FVLFIGLLSQIYCLDVYAETATVPVNPAYRQKLEHVVEIKQDDFPYELDSYLRYMPSRDAHAQSGKVAVTDSASEFSYDIKVFGELPFELAIGSRYIGINNTTSVKLPGCLTRLSIGAETILPFFFDKIYFTLGFAPSFYTDNWNFNSSSFRIPQRYFLIYQPDEKWTFVCGVGIFPDFKDVVIPILGFIYKPNAKLTFNIVPSKPEITYDLNDKLTLLFEAEISGEEFEVSKDNLKNVVLEYNEMHLGTGVKYQVNRYIKSSISAGCVFNRSIKYRDNDFGKVGIKNGLYTELRLDISI
ncbi:MAG: hypothetical protein KJ710_05230, partial [Candidatus Omnitrophica bacterium]|nr:hypothetical protein [Candidatus Omnitrophota bacterium]